MIILTVLLATSLAAQGTKNTAQATPAPEALQLDYVGQSLPGDKAVVFAPGVVSDGHVHGRLAISPDGRDIFWTTFVGPASDGVARMMQVTRTANGWSAPQIPSFVPTNSSAQPLFSPDGKKLIFASRQNDGWSFQYVEKTGSGWSAPKRDGFIPNPTSSFTQSGKVYYSDAMKGKTYQGTYVADYTRNGYLNAQALPTNINSRCIDYTPFIAPDESFLMFSSSRPSRGENMYLYISFRNPDGSWSTPRKMNDALGFSGKARFPSFSPDGKYLFFCGDDGNIYWVRSSVIEKLKAKSVETAPGSPTSPASQKSS
jgi:Tol biopolymer transport system component